MPHFSINSALSHCHSKSYGCQAPKRKRKRSLKPQAFLRQVVRAVLPLGEGVVLDPFAGAGSTLAAAEAIGYASVGVEKDAHYFDMACEAIPKLERLGSNGDAQSL